MRRRQFLGLIGSVTAAWPLAASAQPPERIRRIGVLTSLTANDPQSRLRVAALARGLQQFDWIDGRNLRVDYRWGGGDAGRMHSYAAELIALAPDVVVAGGSEATAALQQATRIVPIVFVNIGDPVGAGYVDSLSRPSGNATGFMLLEYGLAPKWLELLKEIMPGATRVAVIRDATIASGIGQLGAIRAVSSSSGVEISPIGVSDALEIERAVAAFAHSPGGGMVVTATPSTAFHRDLIISLAVRHRLPTIYPLRFFAEGGGLISYGAEPVDQFRLAAGYVARILSGEKPADLPVQGPTKYELVINLKTAKALGLTMPPTLLARADEVIE
jgi:putative ABC transport system substrate-binding protein